MAAVYLTDLIPSLEAALSVPGTTSPYSAATDDEWLMVFGFGAGRLKLSRENDQIDHL